MYFALRALYRTTESCVLVNGVKTEWFNTIQGVRQGDSLSPSLFNIFINDLASEISDLNLGVQIGDENVSILMYADDVVILSENVENMQTMINYVNQWCTKWKMKINLKKSKIMHFRKEGKVRSDTEIHLGPDIMQYVSEYKYLGVYLDEYLNFYHHAKIISESGSRALGALIAKYKSSKYMGYSTFTKCYDTCILPVLNYGAEIWGYSSETKTVLVQNKAMRVFLGVNQRTPNIGMIGDLGWIPHSITKSICMLNYWNRIVKMDDTRLTKRVFNIDFKTKGKWCKSVKSIFKSIDMLDLYNNKIKCDIKQCKKKLLSNFKNRWSKDVLKKPKLRTYCTFKSDYSIESYITMNLTQQERSILAQFRLGTLPLEIELGRFINKKVEERICKLCDNDVEDEKHFLFECQLYQQDRDIFFTALNIDSNEECSVNIRKLPCQPYW